MSNQTEKKETKKEVNKNTNIKRWFSFHKPKETKAEILVLDENTSSKEQEEPKKTLRNSFALLLSKLSISKKDGYSPRNNSVLYHTQSAKEKRISKEGSSHSHRKSDNQSTDSSVLRDIVHTESDWSDHEDEDSKRGSAKSFKYLSPRNFDEKSSSFETNQKPKKEKFTFNLFFKQTPKTPPTTPIVKTSSNCTPRSETGSFGTPTNVTPRTPRTPRSPRPRTPILQSSKQSNFTEESGEVKEEEVKKEKKLPLVKRRSKSVQEKKSPIGNSNRSPISGRELSNDIFIIEEKENTTVEEEIKKDIKKMIKNVKKEENKETLEEKKKENSPQKETQDSKEIEEKIQKENFPQKEPQESKEIIRINEQQDSIIKKNKTPGTSPNFIPIRGRNENVSEVTINTEGLIKKDSFIFDLELSDVINTMTEDTRKESLFDDPSEKGISEDEDESEDEKDHPSILHLMKNSKIHTKTIGDIF